MFTTAATPLSRDLLARIDAYWRAANYLSVGQFYLYDNPLLREPLSIKHIKPRLLGHFGTTVGLNLVYVHLNRVIKARDLNAIYVAGPGHGGPGLVANAYLEGTYSEVYPDVSQDEEGLRRLFTQFSFPGGIPSHVAPETPGSIHEGGELGYALSHAYGAVFDNPGLLAACVIGDGEAETGPLATSWHSNKFLNPVHDGAVLPILHPHTNGGALLRDLRIPDFRGYAVPVPAPGVVSAEATRVQGVFLRDVLKLNREARNFRIFGPDETASNRWNAVFEHQMQGWLEGYLLTGRHGFFNCYEAWAV